MKRQTSEELEAERASLLESVYGKDWKAISEAKFKISMATSVTPQIGIPRLEEKEHAVQSDAGNGENILDTSPIGVHQPKGNEHTTQSDAGAVEDILVPEIEGNDNTVQSRTGEMAGWVLFILVSSVIVTHLFLST